MWLGNIYGDTYAIELEHQFTIGLQLVLHRVDPTLGVIYYKTYVSSRVQMGNFVHTTIVAHISGQAKRPLIPCSSWALVTDH